MPRTPLPSADPPLGSLQSDARQALPDPNRIECMEGLRREFNQVTKCLTRMVCAQEADLTPATAFVRCVQSSLGRYFLLANINRKPQHGRCFGTIHRRPDARSWRPRSPRPSVGANLRPGATVCRVALHADFGTYMPDCAVGIPGSRIIGVPNGIAPPRAAAPVPRAGTGTDGSPARAKMLMAAL